MVAIRKSEVHSLSLIFFNLVGHGPALKWLYETGCKLEDEYLNISKFNRCFLFLFCPKDNLVLNHC